MNQIAETDRSATLVDALRERALHNADDLVHIFLRDGEKITESLTYRDLDVAARMRAAMLIDAGSAGGNVVLACPHGPEFVRAFAGCLYAGVAAGPVKFPRSRHDLSRLFPVAESAQTTTVLTTREGHQELLTRFPDAAELNELDWIETDTASGPALETVPDIDPERLALLQFTSGSTGRPKGVMVSHRNFLEQVETMRTAMEIGEESVIVSWVPFFHDLGLVFSVVAPMLLGVPAYLMSPEAFIRRPRRLLEAISRFGGTHAGGPNFSYELCLRSAATDLHELDLSSWRVAVNGAEPVREATVRRFTETFKIAGFDPTATTPTYGMAETTLVVTNKRPGEDGKTAWLSTSALAAGKVVHVPPESPGSTAVVSCGVPVPGMVVRVVEPATAQPCRENEIGEVWVQGPCITQGYWNHPDSTRESFHARIAGEEEAGDFLRTGDLAFEHEGELYVAGRLKDLIILGGHNYYPQDIEYVVESCHPTVASGASAAFAIERDGEEKLAVMVEVTGLLLREMTAQAFAERVKEAIWESYQVTVEELVVLRRGALAKTSSGKIRRGECRRKLDDGELGSLTLASLKAAGTRPARTGPVSVPAGLLKPMIRVILSRLVGVAADQIDDDTSFAHYGLTSLGAEQIAAAMEPVVGQPVPVVHVLNHATVNQFAAALDRLAASA